MKKKYIIRLLLILALLFSGISTTHAQSRKRYKGKHSYNKKKFSGSKRNKSYKKLKKYPRKKVKKRQKRNRRVHKTSIKRRTSVSKRSSSKKKHNSKHYKGRYPNSKHQFGTKVEALASVGVVLGNNVSTNNNEFLTKGSAENKTGYHLSAGLLYHLGNHFGVYADIHTSHIPKKSSFINLTGGGLYGKFNFTSYKKKTSLYLFGGISVDNWNYEYRNFTEEVAFTNADDTNIAPITVVEQKYERYQTGNEIMIGTKFGVGLDYQLNRNLGSFIQIGHAQNQSRKFNFNVSNITIDVGVKIALLKNKSLY